MYTANGPMSYCNNQQMHWVPMQFLFSARKRPTLLLMSDCKHLKLPPVNFQTTWVEHISQIDEQTKQDNYKQK